MRSFGPLTGIEVLRTRVDGSVVVIECSFSINLTDLTIEQVLGKRQKIVRDMIEQLRRGARRDAETNPAWVMLRNADGRCPAVDRFLEDTLAPLGEHEATHYNHNGPLGNAIQEAVALAESVARWPEGLKALAARPPALRLGTNAEALLHGLGGFGSAPVLSPLGTASTLSAAELRPEVWPEVRVHGTLSRNEADGLCCLAWHAATNGLPLNINLDDVKASPDILAVACWALSPSVTSLSFKGTDLTANGANTVALERLCGLLRGGHTVTAVFNECNLLRNNLDSESANMLVKIGTEKGIMLSGIKRGQKEANFFDQGLGPGDAILIASDIRASTSLASIVLDKNKIGDKGANTLAAAIRACPLLASISLCNNDISDEGIKALAPAIAASLALTSINLCGNNIGPEGANALAQAVCASAVLARVDVSNNNIAGDSAAQLSTAVLGNPNIEVFNEIPIHEMRLDSITELDLSGKTIGVEGGMVLAGLIPAMLLLASIDLNDNHIGPEGAKALAPAIAASTALTECNVRGNNLDIESAEILAKIGSEKGIMMFGIKRDQKKANFLHQSLSSVDAILIASDIRASPMLISVNLYNNNIGDEGTKALAAAITASPILTECNLLRNNFDSESANMLVKIGSEKGIILSGIKRDQKEANFHNQGLGPADAILIASEIRASPALASVDLSRNRFCGLDEYGRGTYTANGITAIAAAIGDSPVLASVDLGNNRLCGVCDETDDEGNIRQIGTYTAKGITAIAAAIGASAALAWMDLRLNSLGQEEEAMIRKQVRGKPGFKLEL